ncbi:YceD family protein [Celeribacter marinus]|uniref:Uncharacterized protein n=1 Tax=Celeribacter marinus TaxID=1397108 RepID=A0A0N9ZWC0_9RHOB|nr:YceD family protein [Celeribacter marinus]ALI54249.1 Conserved hypothetical protein, Ubiquinol-cytochrome C chaperone locus [Celeribacter marinus]SFK32975.1 Uncharacterized ACR, COG1399 [Celeribacter marinus]
MSKTGLTHWGVPVRLSDLSASRPHKFKLDPTAEHMQSVADTLGLDGLRKLRFSGTLTPIGKSDWQLTGEIGATVTQPCVATLHPVVTRLDEPVVRSYLSHLTEMEGDETAEGDSEIEMPEDDTREALPAELSLTDVAIEALALALPAYPRAEGAQLARTQFTESGKDALTDDDVKPFAGLKALRDKLEKDD